MKKQIWPMARVSGQERLVVVVGRCLGVQLVIDALPEPIRDEDGLHQLQFDPFGVGEVALALRGLRPRSRRCSSSQWSDDAADRNVSEACSGA